MTEKCFDEGTMQAFLDGELDSNLTEAVARHAAACDLCALMMAETEEENSFAFAALDNEFNVLVPTERIRTRLFENIAAEKTSVWQKIFGKNFRWTSPAIAAFASLIIVAGTFAILFFVREESNVSAPFAVVNQPKESVKSPQNLTVVSPVETAAAQTPPENVSPLKVRRAIEKTESANQFKFEKTSYETEPPINKVQPVREPIRNVSQPSETIAGEESYVKTIATLTQKIDASKDFVLKPAARVSYEKDMAVVNDAIDKMRREVRKNPKNDAAKDVLRNSYQNKIDLLNSVAERSELMAVR